MSGMSNDFQMKKPTDMTKININDIGELKQWNLTAALSERVMSNIYQTGLFSSFNKSKLIAAGGSVCLPKVPAFLRGS